MTKETTLKVRLDNKAKTRNTIRQPNHLSFMRDESASKIRTKQAKDVKIPKSLTAHLRELKDLQEADDTQIFLALSGGVDSVFLAHHLLEAEILFTALHFNHRWRNQESNHDEEIRLPPIKFVCWQSTSPQLSSTVIEVNAM